MTKNEKRRFWSHVEIVADADSCWLWTGSRTRGGYGTLHLASGRRIAHREVWRLTRGGIPAGLCVLHRCDNPPCVRPMHLFLGTHADNVADRVAKGRSATGDRNGQRRHPERTARGERHGRSKLTAGLVRSIRDQRAVGTSFNQIAAAVGVSSRAVRGVLTGRTWGHV